jgi:hypothetical protein
VTSPYWIQTSDLEATDYPPVDADEAVAAFRSFDWEAEFPRFNELEAAGEENCPAGIGFVPGDGRILHICPNPDTSALVHYHYEEVWRVLGIVPWTRQRLATSMSCPGSTISDLIRHFFTNDHDWIVRQLNG